MLAVLLKLHHLTNLTHPALSSKCSSDNESPFFKQLVSSTHKGSTKNCICQWGRASVFLRVLCDWILVLELFLQSGFFGPTKYNPLVFCSQAILRRKRILFLIMKFCLTQISSRTEHKNGPKHAAVTISFLKSDGVKMGLILTDSTPISYIGADQVFSPDKREESSTDVQL